MVIVGKFCASCAINVMFLYTSELYPTEIRTQGMSTGVIASRIGAGIGPFFISALVGGAGNLVYGGSNSFVYRRWCF